MWMRLFLLVAALNAAEGASLAPCPEHCRCLDDGEGFRASCDSFDFLRKLRPKQARSLESLAVTHANYTEVDPKISLLRNLKSLDLTGNRIASIKQLPYLPRLETLNLSSNAIRSFSAASLPRSLVALDVSSNRIADLPRDLTLLDNLRILDVSWNPVFCSCDLVDVRSVLESANVRVRGPVFCDGPPHFKGVSWYNEEICPKRSIWDEMLGDAAVLEGSGSGDSAVESETGTFAGRIEDEFLTDLHPKSAEEEEGYEGSGADIESDFRNNPPKPCHINCSTPPPLASDTNSTVSASDGVRILIEDISGAKSEETTTTTTAAPEETFVAVTTKPLDAEVPKEIQKIANTSEEAKNNSTAETGAAVPAPKKSSNTYILLAVLCIVIVMLIVFALYKRTTRRNKKRRQTEADNGISKKPMQEMTELAPLTKIEEESDSAPMTNGRNGKAVDEEKPEDGERVELRKKKREEENDALLTPEAKRVTIKAGELPGSVPRTPLLVNRHISSDGNVITTPSEDQRL